MKRRSEIVDSAATDEGAILVLVRWGDEWEVRIGPHLLMSSKEHGSEEAMAALALERAGATDRAILLGGLGLGFTLRATLDRMREGDAVVVAETSATLVRWNRTHLADLAARPLDDPRVTLRLGDVGARIREATAAWDVILLDVDNGPTALVHDTNAALYGDAGARACHAALRPGGVLAVWSAQDDHAYMKRLARAGFLARKHVVRASERSPRRHVIFLGTRLDDGATRSAAPLRRR